MFWTFMSCLPLSVCMRLTSHSGLVVMQNDCGLGSSVLTAYSSQRGTQGFEVHWWVGGGGGG